MNDDLSLNEAIAVVLIGSGAVDETNFIHHSRVLRQHLADVLGRPVTRVDFDVLRNADDVDSLVIDAQYRAAAAGARS